MRIQDIIGLEKVRAALSKSQGAAQVGGAAVGGKGVGGTTAFTSSTKAQTAAIVASSAAINKATIATNKLNTVQKKAVPGLRKVAEGTRKAGKSAETFGQKMKLAGVRYAAFVVATAAPLAIIATLGKATAAVIEFDSAILKLRQITGQTNEQIGGMRDQILDMATATGTSASEIARVAKVLAQAGQRGDELTESLSALSKVPLTPSFETIDAAIEGTIAALNQFNKEGLTTTEVLDVMTILSNNFAASSEDIAKGISRGGAAFEAIGGTFREFAAIFTTIRQATRESAETIGTFMKTISSRLADPKIVAFLEGKGIRISESIEAGDPVGAIKEIAQALQNTASIQDKIEIGTKLGGRRQISRLLALVSNIDILDETLAAAGASAGAFGEIAEEGLAGLQAQLNIMVQEFNKLVQTLAEPLFIPIIKGVTTAGKAFVRIIEVIKPVIPALAAIVGFAVGFKLLAISISAAAKALTFLSAAGIGSGIPGVLGALTGAAGGQAGTTARQRIQRRLQGGVGLEVGVGAAAAGGFTKGAAKAAKSKIGQLVIIAGLLLVASKMNESFKEAGSSAGVMATSFAQAVSALLIATSLLSGKSITGAISSFVSFMTPAGAAVGGFIAILGALTFAAKKAVDVDVQSIIDAAKKRVADIKVEPLGDDQPDALGKEVINLGEQAIGGIQDSVERFGEGVSGFLASATDRLGNLFTGKGLVTINDADAQQIIDDIVGTNPKLLNAILRSAVERFGKSGFLEGIDQLLAESSKINVGAAKAIRGSLIKALGGLEKVVSKIDQIKIDIKANKLAAAISKASASFETLHVPTTLSHELLLLSDAVGKAAKAIELDAQTFDRISQTVSQNISIISPPTEFTRKAAEQIIQKQDLGGFIDPEQFREITGVAAETLRIKKLLDNFIRSLIASRAKADKLKTLLETPLIDPVDIINPFVDQFLKASDVDITPEAESVFRAAAIKIATQLRDGALNAAGIVADETIIAKELESILGKQNAVSEAAITAFRQWLNAQALQTAKGLEGFKLLAEIDIDTATQAETLVDSLRAVLSNIDLDIGVAFGGARNILLDLARDAGPATKTLQKFEEAFVRQSDLYKQAAEAARTGAGASADLSNRLIEASRDVGKLDVVLNRISEAARRAPQILADFGGDEEAVKAQQLISDQILEQIDRQRKLIKAQAAIDFGQVFETPAKIFAEALKDSAIAVKAFTSALTTRDIEAGAGALSLGITPEGRVTQERKPISEAQITTEQATKTTANLQKALFGAGIDQTFENLRISAIDLAKTTVALQNLFLLPDPGGKRADDNRKLIDTLENFSGNLDQIPGLITSIGKINLQSLSKLTTQLAVKQAKKLGAGEIEKLATKPENIVNIEKALQTLLANQTVVSNPELIADQLSDSLLRAVEVLSTSKDQPQAELEEAPRSFEELKISATEIGNAAATSERAAQETTRATEDIKVASADISIGGTEIKTAAASMITSTERFASIVDTQRDVLMGSPEPDASTLDEGAREAINATTKAVEELGSKVVEISDAVRVQTEQEAERAKEQQDKSIEIEGLEDNTDAISKNSTEFEKSGEDIRGLGADMDRMATAMNDGVGINVETMSDITVDVKNVSEAAKEFTDDFEAVATRVAKAEIRLILQQLAQASSNAELVSTFESVV